MRIIIILVLICVIHAEEMVEPRVIHDLQSALMVCDTATVGIANGLATNALSDIIQDYWYRPSAINEDIKKITSPFGANGLVHDHYGVPIAGKNWEYIGTDAISNTAFRVFYMIKMERGYLPIMYTWYNRGDRWFLFGILWGNMCEQNLQAFRVVQK